MNDSARLKSESEYTSLILLDVVNTLSRLCSST